MRGIVKFSEFSTLQRRYPAQSSLFETLFIVVVTLIAIFATTVTLSQQIADFKTSDSAAPSVSVLDGHH